MVDPRRIDVHHHVTPPSYVTAAAQITYGNAPRMSWSLERSLEDMDKGGVATAIISLPHPVTIWPEPKDKQRALAAGRPRSKVARSLTSSASARRRIPGP